MSPTDLGAALSNSLSLGSILILTALGLAITFGVMRVINMAHGDMLMLGAYTAFVFTDPGALPLVVKNAGVIISALANAFLDLIGQSPAVSLDWRIGFGFHLNLFYAIPLSFLVVGTIGYLLEVCLVRYLYGRPLDTLLATWGVGLILQQVVLLLFGTDLKPMYLPEVVQGHLSLGEVAIPIYRIFIVGITGLCLLLVYLWFYKTSFGLKIRAVVQNRPMASAMGISTRRVDSLTFAFATGLAGVAGCVLGHLYTVKVDMGASYIVEAFMVVILGGMGQLTGSVAGGALIGTGNSVVEKVLGNTQMAKVVILVVVIGVIMIRPSGLFASKERTYD